MRPLTAATLLAAAGFAAWAYAAPAENAESAPRPRFLDALSPGDRIENPHDGGPARAGDPGRPDSLNVTVLDEKDARERSLTSEEVAELTTLAESRTDRPSDRLNELGQKAQFHPYEVVEVGDDYVAYRSWHNRVTYLPAHRINSITRPAPARVDVIPAAR